MRMLSLYSGIGGLDLGAHYAGIETVAFCEADAYCRSVLSRHWPEVPCYESDEFISAASLRDRGVDPNSIDIVAGGPPCQPFSVAGKQRGTNDPRHRWPAMAGIVAELRPPFVVVENVVGFADVAERLVRPDLESLGYTTVRFDIPAAAVGASLVSERIFIVGSTYGSVQSPQVSAPETRQAPIGRDFHSNEEVLAAPGRERSQTWNRSRVRQAQEVSEHPERYEHRDGNDRAEAEHSLAGAASRVAYWLDRQRWPAPRGAARLAHEPAPFAEKPPHWSSAIKAIGNICIPAQVYPIFALIKAVS